MHLAGEDCMTWEMEDTHGDEYERYSGMRCRGMADKYEHSKETLIS
jgi:hypothetical protein